MESNGGAVEFGLFDWIDFAAPEELTGLFEQRMQLLEYADSAGFYCYHLAEHHLTPLSGTPSPGIFLAAASQRTRRIRLGALVYLLPLYHPLRLAQEICMLDHLSGGRLEFGTGRGVSPHELRLLGVEPASARTLHDEAFDLIIEALSTGRLAGFEGKHYRFEPLDMALRPLQKPYPPLWYPASGLERAAILGSHAINTVTQSPAGESTRQMVEAYAGAWRASRESGDRLNAHVALPKFGLVRQVYLAEDHDQAMSEARAAYERHASSFLHLWDVFGEAGRWAHLKDFEGQLQHGGLLIGTPAEIAERIAAQVDATGCNYFVANFTFGNLSDEQVLRSIGLFSKEVMPRITARSAAFS